MLITLIIIRSWGSDKRHYEQFADGTVKDIEDEIPFDLPKNWAWTKAKCIYNIRSAIRIHQTDWQTSGIPFFRGRELVELCKTGNVNPEIFISEELYEQNREKGGVPQKNDLLVSAVGTLGYVHIVEGTRKFYYKDAYILCFENHFKLNPKYTKLVIESDYTQKVIYGGSKGTTVDQLTIENAKDLFIPFPPAEEQERIVSALENALEQINFMEQNKSDLQSVIKQTKSKILDLAIHGKLVPQDPNDEPAEELLKRIATSDNRPYKKFEEEEPFEIPSNWSWCFLGDICSKIKRGKSPKYVDKSTIMAFAQKCNQKDGPTSLNKALYIDETTLKKYPEEEKMQFNDIVINSTGTGTLGRVGIFNCSIPNDVNAVYPDSHVTTVRILPEIDKLYCYYFIKNKQSYLETMGEGSTNQKELKPDTISSLYFPLPPYQEQRRIVAKIEELFKNLAEILQNLSV